MLPILSKTNNDFFSQPVITHSTGLPHKLGTLAENVRHVINWEINAIIKDSTLWPLFVQIADPKQTDELYRYIIDGSGKNCFQFYSLILPRYCPECIKELISRDEEVFWNRVHQIPNIQICLKHKCYLKRVKDSKLFRVNLHKIYPPDISNCPELDSELCMCETTILLAERMNALLHGQATINTNYSSRLKELGYTHGSRVTVNKVIHRFNQFYSKTYLKSIRETSKFIQQLINHPDRRKNITRHILLDYLISTLKPVKVVGKPKFWDAEWFVNLTFQCRNRHCKKYRKHQKIKHVLTHPDNLRRSVGHFSCKCKWEYTVSFPNGPASYVYAKKRRLKKRSPKNRYTKVYLDSQRQQFLQLHKIVHKSPEQRTRLYEIRKQLRLHDSSWLTKQSEVLDEVKKANRVNRVNSKGKEKLKKLKEALKRLKMENNTLRITKTVLLNAAQVSYNQSFSEIHNFLNKVTESRENYRIRRMNQIAK